MIDRRPRRAGIALAAAALLSGCDRGPVVPTPGDEPVHVVLYLIDTLRRDRLGVYGYERPTSPAIDALARDAVVFDNAYAPGPWTIPSIASLMTATYPVDHGVLYWGHTIGEGLSTLPERLHDLGYATGAFVMNPAAGDLSGLRRGYDDFAVTTGPLFVGRWLRGAGPGPFFVYHHTLEPHRPFRAPPEFVERFGQVPDALRERINRGTGQHLQLLRVDKARGRPPGTTDNSPDNRNDR